MADRADDVRARRTSARERRRSSVSEPFERMDQAAGEAAEQATPRPNGQLAGAAAKVVGTAVAAGLLGALGGAAKALLERRGGDRPRSTEEQDGDGDAEPEARATGESEPVGAEGGAVEEEQSEPEQESAERAPDSGADDEESQARTHGASRNEAAEIVAEARRRLEGLLGADAERVSGLERDDGRWSVMLEVVEVSRIPESTDVLATYELVLDEDRNLISATRKRRYRRSQVDEA